MQPWHLLRDYVNAEAGADDLFIQGCWDQAKVMVDDFMGTKTVPNEVYTRAVTECGAALFNRRRSQQKQGDGYVTGTPVFVHKNPMGSVFPMLAPYVGRF